MKGALEDITVPGVPLLPHERRLAEWSMARQQRNRTEQVMRIEENYGPTGVALLFASAAWILPGSALAIFAVVLVVAMQDLTVFYWVLGAAALIILSGIPRALQAIAASRRHRGDRPYRW